MMGNGLKSHHIGAERVNGGTAKGKSSMQPLGKEPCRQTDIRGEARLRDADAMTRSTALAVNPAPKPPAHHLAHHPVPVSEPANPA
jgi:hypothetical protein